MSWRNIPGYFSEQDAEVYDFAVTELIAMRPHPLVIVEVGCWHGRSTIRLAERLTGREDRIFAVDHWLGSPNESAHIQEVKDSGCGSMFPTFWHNVCQQGKQALIRPICLPSIAAAGAFQDGSVDLVFIDAEHTRHAVTADLLAWWPKVRSGGFIGGHDYDHPPWPEVKQAVDEFFGQQPRLRFGYSFLYQKRSGPRRLDNDGILQVAEIGV